MGDRSPADMRVRPELGLPERYEPLRHIAAGGMASVWCARDQALGRNVAIKARAQGAYAERVAGGWFLDFNLRRDQLARYGLTIEKMLRFVIEDVGGVEGAYGERPASAAAVAY